MFKNSEIKTLALLFSSVFSFSALAQSHFFKYQWPLVKGADHYLITIAEPKRQYQVYTRGNLLYLEKDEAYEVAAIAANKKILKYIPLEVSLLPYRPELLIEEKPRPKAKDPIQTLPKKEPVISPEERARRNEVRKLLEEEQKAFEGPPSRRLVAALGFGREDLVVEGGTSAFTGSSPVLISSGSLEIQRNSPGALLSSLNLKGQFHYFVSSEKESSLGGEDVVSYRRVRLHLTGDLHLVERSSFSVFLESGLSFVELPVPTLTAEDYTNLGPGTAIGLALGIRASYSFHDTWKLYAHAYTVPYSFSSYTLSASAIDFAIRYNVIPELLDAEIRAFIQKEKLSLPINCQAVVEQCLTDAKVSSNLRGLALGLGLAF